MLNDLLGTIWRRAPKSLKRLTVRLSHPRFAVTAGAVITDSRGRVLLLKHRFRPGKGWGMPGGFMDLSIEAAKSMRFKPALKDGRNVSQFATVEYNYNKF